MAILKKMALLEDLLERPIIFPIFLDWFLKAELRSILQSRTQRLLIPHTGLLPQETFFLVKDHWRKVQCNIVDQPHLRNHLVISLSEIINLRIGDLNQVKTGMRDLMQANPQAATHCNWGRGGISPINTLVDRNGKEVLTDYDLTEHRMT
ncbi:hypothetical protein H0H93_015649 [Arthromyces matolae]|nr:hypothetical protein H0H93_015649 [Arthromyces matolae]